MTAPDHKIIMDGEKERQGDFVFTALETGEYKFCFDNHMSTFAEKFVDFEIAVRVPLSHQPVEDAAGNHSLLHTTPGRLFSITDPESVVFIG